MSSMSFMDNLLNGVVVAWLPLGELTNYEQPTKYLVSSKNYSNDFETPVLTAGKTFVLGYTDEINGIYRASANPVIIFDDFTTANKWVDFDFKVKSSAMKMITSRDEGRTLLKYIYYWLNTLPSEFVDGDHKRQWIGNYTSKKVPIPCPDNPRNSLEIQAEIVRILDAFTELTAELTAELTSRKKQYNHYRDQLLSFEDAEVEWKTLGEVIYSLKTGLNPRQNFQLNTPDAQGYYVTVREIQNGKVTFLGKTDRVNEQALKLINGRSQLDAGDVLFSGTGTVGRTAVIEDKPENWNIKEGVYVIKPVQEKMLPRYLAHLLNSSETVKEYSKKIVGNPVVSLPMGDFRNLKIPVPPLDEQARIVAILDIFDALTNSLTEGLPREIELRQKQYEYYRDQLLSFSKSEAVEA